MRVPGGVLFSSPSHELTSCFPFSLSLRSAFKGGSNPAIRTLFYRLVRLLGHSIQPIFVFDGPKKPAFKRNKRSSGNGDAAAKGMAKRVIRLFGFTIHDAPGEAEAECALLQQKGIVDAVLSEDVDTIMFGCTKTLRNWSSEGRSSKTPTHVSLYDAGELQHSESGLDREGMVLVALMSGGDYLPEGIPGCGVKVACEAAKAGFGRSLCRIKIADKAALASWKDHLLKELRTNDSGYFRTRHKALTVPESFPNMDVLRYYTHPVVSSQAHLDRLGAEFPPKSPVNIVGLRQFVEETFDWTYRIGATKLIRVLAPSLLAHALLDRSSVASPLPDDPDVILQDESTLVKAISGRRCHTSTDSTPELRLSCIPLGLVNLDLDAEQQQETTVSYGRDGLALNSDDEYEDEAAEGELESRTKTADKLGFDPAKPFLAWIPASVAKLGVPLTVEDWEERQRSKESRMTAKPARRTRSKAKELPTGALDRYVKVSVPNDNAFPTTSFSHATETGSVLSPLTQSPLPRSAPIEIGTSALTKVASSIGSQPSQKSRSVARDRSSVRLKVSAGTPPPKAQTNPWTLASSQNSGPRVTKAGGSSKSGDGPPDHQPIVIASSPISSPPLSAPNREVSLDKRPQSPSTEGASSPPRPPGDTLVENPYQRSPSSQPGCGQTPTKSQRARTTRSSLRMSQTGKARPLGRSATQTSIKNYGVLTETKSPQISSKVVTQSDPIELSEGEDDAGPLRPRRAPPVLLTAREPKNTSPNYGLIPYGCVAPLGPDPFESEGRASEENVDWSEGKESRAKTTRLYASRNSDVGYFKEIDVTIDEAERLCKDDASAGGKPRTIGRYSDISIVDLTSVEGHG